MKHQYLKNVASLKLDSELCTGCGICLDVCPHEVLAAREKKVYIADLDACMECGACALNCPFNALSVAAGVGCASALLVASLTGREAVCGCCGPDPSETAC